MSGTQEEPHGEADLKAMWRVLAAWIRATDTKGAVGPALAKRLQQFPRLHPSDLDQKLPRTAPPLRLDRFGWVVGGPLPRYEPPVVPVATAVVEEMVDGRVRELKLRVALLRERDDGSVHAEGWRFESAEPQEKARDEAPDAASTEDDNERPVSGPPHPYSHAQAIFGWERDSPCLIHPPHQDGDACDGIDPIGDAVLDAERLRVARSMLATHPAFPLPAQTLTGLAFAVIATLYGAQKANEIVEGDAWLARLGGLLAADLELMRGLNR